MNKEDVKVDSDTRPQIIKRASHKMDREEHLNLDRDDAVQAIVHSGVWINSLINTKITRN